MGFSRMIKVPIGIFDAANNPTPHCFSEGLISNIFEIKMFLILTNSQQPAGLTLHTVVRQEVGRDNLFNQLVKCTKVG